MESLQLYGIKDFVAFDEAQGEAGGDEVDSGLEPQGDVFGFYIRHRSPHSRGLNEALHTGRGGEDVGEVVPEPRHIALRPHHACGEKEDEAEEGEAE